jgi:hypothetical protein
MNHLKESMQATTRYAMMQAPPFVQNNRANCSEESGSNVFAISRIFCQIPRQSF